MDNLKKIEAFLDMPSEDDMVYGEALTEQVEDNGLPTEIRIPASEYPEYDEYYDDLDGELYTELTMYIEDRYGQPVDFHWEITPDEIIIDDITWFDDEDIEPEVEEQEVDFPEDDVMEDLNEAKLRKNDLTDENLANFEMELQEIKDNLADFGPEGLYAVPYESFKREFPIFTEKVIESFLDEMEDDGEGDWQEGELIWENDWPCLIEGAEKLLNGKGFQWEKLYTKYYKPANDPVEVNDVDDYDDYDGDMYEESLHESKLNEKLPAELITAIKKVGGFEKDYHLNGLDIEDAEAKIITPEEAKELKKDIIDNEYVCVIYNGDVYFPFTHKITPTFPKKPDRVSVNKLLNDGTIYYIKDRPRKHWKDRYRTYGDKTNSHELTPDEKSASFEKSRWREFNYRNDELKKRLAQVNKMRDDVFNSVSGMYESLDESLPTEVKVPDSFDFENGGEEEFFKNKFGKVPVDWDVKPTVEGTKFINIKWGVDESLNEAGNLHITDYNDMKRLGSKKWYSVENKDYFDDISDFNDIYVNPDKKTGVAKNKKTGKTYKFDKAGNRVRETLENGRIDTRETEILDKAIATVRYDYLGDDDEAFADIAINDWGMTPEELDIFCGVDVNNIDESLTEDTDTKVGDDWFIFVDRSGSWDAKKSDIALRILKHQFLNRGPEVRVLYFNNKIYSMDPGDGNYGTLGTPILNCIKKYKPTNVGIITDDDINDCTEKVTVPGRVVFLFADNRQSVNLINHLHGEQGTQIDGFDVYETNNLGRSPEVAKNKQKSVQDGDTYKAFPSKRSSDLIKKGKRHRNESLTEAKEATYLVLFDTWYEPDYRLVKASSKKEAKDKVKKAFGDEKLYNIDVDLYSGDEDDLPEGEKWLNEALTEASKSDQEKVQKIVDTLKVLEKKSKYGDEGKNFMKTVIQKLSNDGQVWFDGNNNFYDSEWDATNSGARHVYGFTRSLLNKFTNQKPGILAKLFGSDFANNLEKIKEFSSSINPDEIDRISRAVNQLYQNIHIWQKPGDSDETGRSKERDMAWKNINKILLPKQNELVSKDEEGFKLLGASFRKNILDSSIYRKHMLTDGVEKKIDYIFDVFRRHGFNE